MNRRGFLGTLATLCAGPMAWLGMGKAKAAGTLSYNGVALSRIKRISTHMQAPIISRFGNKIMQTRLVVEMHQPFRPSDFDEVNTLMPRMAKGYFRQTVYIQSWRDGMGFSIDIADQECPVKPT